MPKAKTSGHEVDSATPRGSLKRIGCDDLTAHSLDKHRTDLYQQIRRATVATFALATATDKVAVSIIRRLEDATTSLELAAGRINEGIAKIIGPRSTLAQLEKEERGRSEKRSVSGFNPNNDLVNERIEGAKKNLASIQKSKALNELKLDGNRLPTFRGDEGELFRLYAHKMRYYFDARNIRWDDPSLSPRILAVLGSTLEGPSGQWWVDRCLDITSVEEILKEIKAEFVLHDLQL
ncbi:hypothetical protein PsorP6_015329 [Peronosclerospora sorghi]|uniref:Uncharacterized protein n=1 Tax=Peronosclerospora sorghi TaxID=230839 RepID=A0ACC0VV72_9STRA|nr:hypothetical protein PsorP6_015329 [Peronosclerospora sorghi]